MGGFDRLRGEDVGSLIVYYSYLSIYMDIDIDITNTGIYLSPSIRAVESFPRSISAIYPSPGIDSTP